MQCNWAMTCKLRLCLGDCSWVHVERNAYVWCLWMLCVMPGVCDWFSETCRLLEFTMAQRGSGIWITLHIWMIRHFCQEKISQDIVVTLLYYCYFSRQLLLLLFNCTFLIFSCLFNLQYCIQQDGLDHLEFAKHKKINMNSYSVLCARKVQQ